MLNFDENGFLIPKQIIYTTLEEVEEVFVDSFP